MGQNDHLDRRDQRRDAKRQRIQQQREEVLVTSIDPAALLRAIDAMVHCGAAIRIGCTRDRGAWAFGIYGDGDKPYTEYVQPSEDVNAYLWNLAEFFDQTGGVLAR